MNKKSSQETKKKPKKQKKIEDKMLNKLIEKKFSTHMGDDFRRDPLKLGLGPQSPKSLSKCIHLSPNLTTYILD